MNRDQAIKRMGDIVASEGSARMIDVWNDLFAAISLPKEELETLPCDVQLPGVLMRKGVSMYALISALKRREGWSEEDTRLRSAPKAGSVEPVVRNEDRLSDGIAAAFRRIAETPVDLGSEMNSIIAENLDDLYEGNTDEASNA